PAKVKGTTSKRMLTDIISLIRFELKIDDMLLPYGDIINRNYRDWMFKKNAGPIQFTNEQVEWLRMIKEHLVTSVRIDKKDFELSPFVDRGGLGKFWNLFGDDSEILINELIEELAA
ncbi:MAG: restriction endonuclease subunit R, partial [Ignavibacteriae bacterium]|nr:restriction endonuclease subunit R [Ignavibacteriota bacterium]NOH00376.1 restriction endonuclease subunit R [Ignavibacteriota bacterium]